MPGFLSNEQIETNRIELHCQARRVARKDLIDLTCANPTKQGYMFPRDVLQRGFMEYLNNRQYCPEAKGLIAAREAVSEYYRGRGWQVDPEHIFITASTSESYALLMGLLASSAESFLAPTISYPLFEYFAEYQQMNLVGYRLTRDTGYHWQIDQESLRANCQKDTRGVLIVSPHNPTGMVLSESLPALGELGLPLICDEVFSEFYWGGASTIPVAALYPTTPVFMLNGISKMFALPDMKLGWIALNDKAFARYGERLEILNDTFLSASSSIQHMLPTIFREGWLFVQEMKNQLRDNIDYLCRELNSIPGLRAATPQGGYYLLVSYDFDLDEEDLCVRLIDAGVLMHPGYMFGNLGANYLVISALVQREKLAAGLKIIRETTRQLDALSTK